MKKFKIAVIDTALSVENLPENILGKVETKNYFEFDNKAMHSSMVINTIIKYTDADLIEKIYLYNVFNKEHRGSGLKVISALEDIIQKNDTDFLIMSITLTNEDRYDYIESLCKRITASETIIIASDSNKLTKDVCYPFSFDCVYGISQGAFSKNPFFCVKDIERKHIIGDAAPEFIWCGKNNYCLFGGTSKAVPKFLASIINAFSNKRDISCEKIEEWVKNDSLSLEDNTIFQLKDVSSVPVYSKEIYDSICRYIREFSIDISKYGDITPLFNLVHLENNELSMFLRYILKKFGINTSLDNMRYSDFASLGKLCVYIGRQM